MKLVYEAEIDCDNDAFEGALSQLNEATYLVIDGLKKMKAPTIEPNGTMMRAIYDANGNFVGHVSIKHQP